MPASKSKGQKSTYPDAADVAAGCNGADGGDARGRRIADCHGPNTDIERLASTDKKSIPRTVPPEPPLIPILSEAYPVQEPSGSPSEQVAVDEAESDAAQVIKHHDTTLMKATPWPNYDVTGWDVKVVCGPYRWYLHKDVLRKCRYFSSLLSQRSEDSEAGSTICLSNHNAGQLAQVLRFMYYYDYPGADYDSKNPLYGDSLLTNTVMYIAGASVDHRGMMRFATRHIESWTNAVFPGSATKSTTEAQGKQRQRELSVYAKSPLYEAVCDANGLLDYAVLRLVHPLHRSLTIVYEQPTEKHAGLLKDLRVVLIRFVATALPLLATNAAFQAHFRNEWLRPLQSQFHGAAFAKRSLADWVMADHSVLFDLHLVGWHKGQVMGDASCTRTPPEPSVGRILSLLKRLSRIELSRIRKTARNGSLEEGNEENEGGRASSEEIESEADRQERRNRLGECLRDQEQTHRELLFWLEKTVSR